MSAFTWLRLWHEVRDDPKVQALPDADFRSWIDCLITASMNDPRGKLPALELLSFFLRKSIDETASLCDRLIEARLFDRHTDGSLWIHGWNQRQYESDTSTERVRKYRKKQKRMQKKGNVSRNVPETFNETPQSQSQKQNIYFPNYGSSSSSRGNGTTTTNTNLKPPQALVEALVVRGIEVPLRDWDPPAWQEDRNRGRPEGPGKLIKLTLRHVQRLLDANPEATDEEILQICNEKIAENVPWKRPPNKPIRRWPAFLVVAVTDELRNRRAS